MDIEEIHNLSGLIINAKSRIERVDYFLSEIIVGTKKYSAEVRLEIDQGRMPYIEYLTKDEIISFLQRRRQEELLVLSAHQDSFNKENK